MKKLKLAIIFGGKSVEHEVSVISARNVYHTLDKTRYVVSLAGISKKGKWIAISPQELADLKSVPEKGRIFENKELLGIDVVFPLIHGTGGEDGALQGYLQTLGVPFVGPGVLGSAIGMDKEIAKRLLREAGLPVVDFLVIRKSDSKYPSYVQVVRKLGKPFFLKPASLGSSVGVSKVQNAKGYHQALSQAFRFDGKILLETFVRGREVECAILGNGRPQASKLGEILPMHDFYTYEAKYLDEKGASYIIPAKLGQALGREIQKMAIQAFRVLQCQGMARVDFFVTKDEKIYINEINTIPGFTSISMYPKLWEASGLPYSKLMDKLIALALE